MNKLDEIILEAQKEWSIDTKLAKQIAIEFAKHILKEAVYSVKEEIVCDKESAEHFNVCVKNKMYSIIDNYE
jgi:hypothetical protein